MFMVVLIVELMCSKTFVLMSSSECFFGLLRVLFCVAEMIIVFLFRPASTWRLISLLLKKFRTFTIILAIHWKFCPIWQWLNLESIHWAIHYIIKAAHWDHYIIRLLYLYINLSCRFGVWGNGIDCCGILPKANCWGASIPCGLGCCMVVTGVLTEGGIVWAASWNCCTIPVHMTLSNIAFCCCNIRACSLLMCFAPCSSSTRKFSVNDGSSTDCLDLLLGLECELLDKFLTLEGGWLPLLLFDISWLTQ